MARSHSQAPESVGHVNVTPLIDVVMCLIIFFLVCGTLAVTPWKEPVTVPKAANGEDPVDKQGRLVVTVSRVEGGASVKVATTSVTWADLGEHLRAAKAGNRELKVVVRADADLPYEYISPVLVGCAQANVSKVEFATRKM